MEQSMKNGAIFSGRYYTTHSKITTNYTTGNPERRWICETGFSAFREWKLPVYVNGSTDASGNKKKTSCSGMAVIVPVPAETSQVLMWRLVLRAHICVRMLLM